MHCSILNFEGLVGVIQEAHQLFFQQASKAVNVILTARNWLIGYYIAEYELQGADRAQYGEALLSKLAKKLSFTGVKRMDARELRRFRQFYSCYPQIRETVSRV